MPSFKSITVSDFNELHEQGIYCVKVSATTQHRPDKSTGQGFMEMIVFKPDNNANYSTQVVFSWDYIWSRVCTGGTWGVWHRIATTTY